jgi:3-methyladenine DNA glycosylase AlkD
MSEPTPPPTVDAILAELRSLGSEANRAGMAHFGIKTDRAFGISMAVLKPLARRLKRNHRLAADLWQSGYHEARLLAVLVEEPDKVTVAQMDRWARTLDSWDICDQACARLFVRTPFVEDAIRRWTKDEREFVRRAGFALIAAYTVHGKSVPDERFVPFLDLIEEHATDDRNFVRKAVNWALRQIGKRSMALQGPALSLARRLAASTNPTARWIGKDAIRELQLDTQLERPAQRSTPRRASLSSR